MHHNAIRLICITVLTVVAGMIPVTVSQAAAPAQEHVVGQNHKYSCTWQGHTVQLKHIAAVAIERNRDATVAGQCKHFQTDDKYYKSLVGKNINTFVAWRQYPGVFVVRNALQGKQKVKGDWTFPIGESQPGVLHGSVKDVTSKKGLKGAIVEAQQCVTKPTRSCTTYTAKTNGKGQYTIKFYVTGKYKVTVSDSGYTTTSAKSVTISYGKSASMSFTLAHQAQATTLAVTANPNPVSAGQSTTITVTLGQPVDDGAVTFTGTGPNGATFTSQSCTPTAGTCTINWTPSMSGSWLITASWAGDTSYTSTANSVTIGVNALTANLAVTGSPATPSVNQQVTVTAKLDQSVSDGSVSFTVTGPSGTTATIATCTPQNGVCTGTFTPSASGSWTVSATWTGDSSFGPATASTVLPVGTSALSVSVSSNPTQPTVNQLTTAVVKLSQPVSDGTVTVTFSGPNGATAVNSQTCTPASGTCVVQWTPTAQGTWSVTASWSGDAVYTQATGTGGVAVTGINTTLAVAANPNPGIKKQDGTLSASLGNTSISDGVITFTVTGPGNPRLSTQTCTPKNGTCSVTWNPDTTGQWTILATYSGDAIYQPATATSIIVQVNGVNLTLTATPTTLQLGSVGGLLAKLGQPVSDGTISFTAVGPGGISVSIPSCGPVSGQCGASWQPTVSGAWILTASWSGDQTYPGTTSSQVTVQVVSGSPIVVTAQSNSITLNTPDPLTAQLNVPASDGRITFTAVGPDNATVTVGSCQPTNGHCGINSFAPSQPGPYSITATWTGDNQNPSVTSAPIVVVATGSTASFLSLTITPNTPQVGQQATLQANVSPAVSDGTVTFNLFSPAGTKTTVSCTPAGGVCAQSWTPNVNGSWVIVVQWSGDSQYSASNAVQRTVNVASPATTTTLVANPTSLSPGQQGTLTATVSQPVNDGTITFTATSPSGGNPNFNPSTCTPVNGTCSVHWQPTTDGTYSITATWSGDNQYTGAASTAVTVTVSGTSLALTANPNPANVNQVVTLTATTGSNTATGQITFSFTPPANTSSNQAADQKCTLNNGSCSIAWKPDVSGSWTITATLSNGNTQAAPATLTLAVGGTQPAHLQLTSDQASVTLGGTIHLTGSLDKAVSDGTISFTATGPSNASVTIGSCTPTSGVCSVAWTPNATGTWTVMAAWSGDNVYQSATAQSLNITVNPQPLTIVVGVSPNPATVNQTVTLPATLQNNGQTVDVSDGTISFSFTGPNGESSPTLTCQPQHGVCQVTWTPTVATSNGPPTTYWTITTSWTGDNNYSAQSVTTKVSVRGGTLTENITFNPSPPVVNHSDTITVDLGHPINDGTVTLKLTASPTGSNAHLGTASCTPSNGICTFTWQPDTIGTYTFEADWSGDSQFRPDQESASANVVRDNISSFTIQSNPTSPTHGQAASLYVAISPAVSDGTVTFTVTRPDGSTQTLNPNTCAPKSGTCSVTWTPDVAGTWTVQATWSGDNIYNSAQTQKTPITVK